MIDLNKWIKDWLTSFDHVIKGEHNHAPGLAIVRDCPACEAWCDEVIARDPTERPRELMTDSGLVK